MGMRLENMKIYIDSNNGVATEPMLIRVFKGYMERVPFTPNIFSSVCCYLLVDPKVKRLFTWIGVRSGMRDRNHVDKMAGILIENDLPDFRRVPVVRESMVNRSMNEEVAAFRQVLAGTPVDLVQLNTEEPPVYTHLLYIVTPGKTSPTLHLLDERSPGEGIIANSLFHYGLLLGRSGAAFVLKAEYECYIYCTASCTAEMKDSALSSVSTPPHGPSIFTTVVHEGHEPVLFKQRFSGWPYGSISPVGGRRQRLQSPAARKEQLMQQHQLQQQASLILGSPVERRTSIMRRTDTSSIARLKSLPRESSMIPVIVTNSRTTWRPEKQGNGEIVPSKKDWFEEQIGENESKEPLIPLSFTGIQAEVKRSMLNSEVGTIGAIAAGLGDPSDASLKMKSALDGKSLVRQWRVKMSADWRMLMVDGVSDDQRLNTAQKESELTFTEVSAARFGIFTSGDAYIITSSRAFVIVTEAGEERGGVNTEVRVETVVYLWLGRDYPVRSQLKSKVKEGASETMLKNIIGAGNVSEQLVTRVIVDQGREPPYLLALFSRSPGGIIIISGRTIVRDKGSSRSQEDPESPTSPLPELRPLVRAPIQQIPPPAPEEVAPVPPPGTPPSFLTGFKLGSSPLQSNRGLSLIYGGKIHIFEIFEVPSFPFLAPAGIICNEIDPLMLIEKGMQPRKSYIIIVGAHRSSGSYSSMWVWHTAGESERMEGFLARLVRSGHMLFLPKCSKHVPPGLMRGYVYHLKVGCVIPDDFWESIGVNAGSPPKICSEGPLLRAVRLWQIDYQFALEVSLKVELGDSPDDAHWLPYVQEIGMLNCFTQIDLSCHHSYILDAGSDTVFVWHGSQSSMKSRELCVRCAKIYAESTMVGVDVARTLIPSVIQVESGEEPSEFMGCFRGWTPSHQLPADPSLPPIDPYNLLDEDFEDVQAAENALVKAAQNDRSDKESSCSYVEPPVLNQHLPPRPKSSNRLSGRRSRGSSIGSINGLKLAMDSPGRPPLLRYNPDQERGHTVSVNYWWDSVEEGAVFRVTVREGRRGSTLGAKGQSSTAWHCESSMADFKALHFFLEGYCEGMKNPFPGEKHKDLSPKELAQLLALWLGELLRAGLILPLRARFRLQAFLGVKGLASLRMAAEAEAGKQANEGLAEHCCLSASYTSGLPKVGIFAPLREELIKVGKEVAADQAALKYKLTEIDTRLSFARAQEEDERHKASLYKKDLDSLFKRRRRLRIELHTAQSPVQSRFGDAASKRRTRRTLDLTDVKRGSSTQNIRNFVNSTPPRGHSRSLSPGQVGIWDKMKGIILGMGARARTRDPSNTPKSSRSARSSTSIMPSPRSIDGDIAAITGDASIIFSDAGPEVDFLAVEGTLRGTVEELAAVEYGYSEKLKRRNEHVVRADRARGAVEDAEAAMAMLAAAAATLLVRGDTHVDRYMEALAESGAVLVPRGGEFSIQGKTFEYPSPSPTEKCG